MVGTDLRCSLVQLIGFVAFATSELLSRGMGLVTSCQTGARSWRVSHCRHLVYFSWDGGKPVSVGAESAVPGNPCFLRLLQPEVHRWSGSCSVVAASSLQSSTFWSIHIPCALNTSVVCFYLFWFWCSSWHFTLAQSFHICKFHISSCFIPVSMGCTKAHFNRRVLSTMTSFYFFKLVWRIVCKCRAGISKCTNVNVGAQSL